MRFWLLFVAICCVGGCRSPHAAYRMKACHSPSIGSATQIVSTTTVGAQHKYSIEELVQLAITNNPRIFEAEHRIAALKHRIPQQLALPDPMINTTTPLAPIETAAGRQAFGLGVSQKFVDVDRRATNAAIANDEVLAAEAELVRIRQEIAEQTRVACYQLLAVRETIRVTQEDIQSLAQIEEVILRKYEVQASVSQQDVLNVHIEQSKVENQLVELKQKEKSYAARVARLARLEPGAIVGLADSLSDVLDSSDADSLIAQALESRPELSRQLAQIRADHKKICLANLQQRPDFTVGLNWIATSNRGISPVANGDDALLLGVGFNLPINKSRIRSAICEAQEAKLASSAKLESLKDQIAEEVFDSVAKLDSAGATLSLIQEDIVPKAERSLELSIEEYANAKTDFAQLIANWRSLLQYRIAVANLQSQRRQLLATLGRQVGLLEPIHPPSASLNQVQPDVDTKKDVEKSPKAVGEGMNS